MNIPLKIGFDVGSTTVKMVVLDGSGKSIFERYRRHNSETRKVLRELVTEARADLADDAQARVAMTGSGALAIHEPLGWPFVQELVAEELALRAMAPGTDVIVELGGEDSKIAYLTGGREQRMNGTCAGGTGAFIDQMADLLDIPLGDLDQYARQGTCIHPIASRCGVFAKTDIQALLNQGAGKENLVVSIFQAVVNQVIDSLACARAIRGNVALLGGPFHFFKELGERFYLSLPETRRMSIRDGRFFPALGCALWEEDAPIFRISEISRILDETRIPVEAKTTDALFAIEEDLAEFRTRHGGSTVPRKPIEEARGPCFLGMDGGSTTTKATLIDADGALLFSAYKNNEGDPLSCAIEILKDTYAHLPAEAFIAYSAATGYGEPYLTKALGLDVGEIETVAHSEAALAFQADTDLILDIGGQDMKCVRLKNGRIDKIALNEACSAGCGSFVENFARSHGLDLDRFVELALQARGPVDLGSRCTVFMNSKVKEAQKEGATLADICAGIARSVVENALFKVLRLKGPSDLGHNIVAQGGTFANDAVLRCLELRIGRGVVRPDIAPLMGAYGAALIARDRCPQSEASASSIVSERELAELKAETSSTTCDGCANKCALTLHRFKNGAVQIAGNKCDRPGSDKFEKNSPPDLCAYKYRRVFDYEPLKKEQARRGEIGIPRVLNIYEDYPFWFAFFTALGFRVVLSGETAEVLRSATWGSVPSDTVCYPAKLAHAHVRDLIRKGLTTIFYPCVAYEKKDEPKRANHFNCPVVISYPEMIRNNQSEIREGAVDFLYPFLQLENPENLGRRLRHVLKKWRVEAAEIEGAIAEGIAARDLLKADLLKMGAQAIDWIERSGRNAIVLAGRPYHIDPGINHGINRIATGLGLGVLTEDSVLPGQSSQKEGPRKLRVAEQWVYPSRLYSAAQFAAGRTDIGYVQLVSFGCGIDAITAEQVDELLAAGECPRALIKIDEINHLGAAKIRLRSLKAVMDASDKNRKVEAYSFRRALFLPPMRRTHTLLMNMISPVHYRMMAPAWKAEGYHLEILDETGPAIMDEGRRFVNNDMCFPAILMIGQFIAALKSGRYDVERTTLAMMQTGGRCRMTNYVALLKKALRDSGFPQVPIISLNVAGLEKQPGFHLTPGLGNKIVLIAIYGDLLQKLLLRTRPYERQRGSAQKLYEAWLSTCEEAIQDGRHQRFREILRGMIADFSSLRLEDRRRPRVGVVGEIYVKYNSFANNDLIRLIEDGGAEVVIPDLMTWLMYVAYDSTIKFDLYEKCAISRFADAAFIKFVEARYLKEVRRALSESKLFHATSPIAELAKLADPIASLGDQAGEGWSQVAEMVDLANRGIANIVCVQPFACICSHIVGRGVFGAMRRRYPGLNITAIDYDPGVSQSNQINRIKLLLSGAFPGGRP